MLTSILIPSERNRDGGGDDAARAASSRFLAIG